jgi:hypothetical protein
MRWRRSNSTCESSCGARLADEPQPGPMLVVSRSQTATFLRSRGAFLRPAFAEASAGMSAKALAAASRPERGAGGAPGGGSLSRRALRKRREPRLRDAAVRGKPERASRRSNPGGFGPAPRIASRSCLRLSPRGRPLLPGVAPGRPKAPNLPGTVYEPRPGRHTSLRLRDRLRKTPLMSEDDES